MIFLKLTDGMGNQLFQYAYARYLKEQRKQKIYLDTLKLGGKYVRSYALDNFVLNEDVVIPSRFIQWCSRVYTKCIRLFLNRICRWSLHTQLGYDKFASVGYYTSDEPIKYFNTKRQRYPLTFVRGFFQSGKYLNQIRPVLLKEFQLKKNPDKKELTTMAEQMRKQNSVCLHIRRGDYLKYSKFNVCNEKYYQEGLKYIKERVENPVFYVFSNTRKDVLWIKENYHFDANVVYVELGNSEIEDFYLMQQCKHFIISNSTYSWWTAWLADYTHKIIVAPNPWMRGDEDTEDIYSDNMHMVNVDGL